MFDMLNESNKSNELNNPNIINFKQQSDIESGIELNPLISTVDNTNTQNEHKIENLQKLSYAVDTTKILKEVIHYYTHFLMFIIFEVLFYFNYVVQYEEKLIYKMISNLMDKIVDYISIDFLKYEKCGFYDQACKIFVDDSTNKNNTQIYDNALYLIYGMSAFLIFLIILETNMFKQKSSFPKEFKKSLLLMLFVGIFDYLFFNYFILEYKIIDTGELMCYLYEHDSNGCQHTNSTVS